MRFLAILVRWIAVCHIALVIMESQFFRALVNVLNPRPEDYMWRSADRVRDAVIEDFEASKQKMKARLQQSRSVVHLSFDLWTSKNCLPFIGVYAHWLDSQDFEPKSALIALRKLNGRHTGENIAEKLVEIILDFGIADRLGYFMADNANSNDVAIQHILARFEPDVRPETRRVRCVGHIFNLAANAFLFGENADAFELDNDNMDEGRLSEEQELKVLAEWRKRRHRQVAKYRRLDQANSSAPSGILQSSGR